MNVYLNALGVSSALGDGVTATRQNLQDESFVGLTHTGQFSNGVAVPLGRVTTELPALDHLALSHQSRNNQLLLHAFEQIAAPVEEACKQFGKARVAVVLGTSTSGVAEAEAAFAVYENSQAWPQNFIYGQQEIGSPALFLSEYLSLSGPAYTVSTACSSAAKALASARRLLQLGVCDAVIAGGVDTLCGLTVQGFKALDAISEQPCLPFSRNRQGINIGEGAALFLMTKQPSTVALTGVGESSDGHHISAPDPSGDGAYRAMLAALKQAKCAPGSVDYINLHGTGTLQNDAMESKAVYRLFADAVYCSSTKPLTGHCLGASGAIEAAIAWIMLQTDFGDILPAQYGDGVIDDSLPPIALLQAATAQPLHRILSNSFAFGGNNISLLLERQGSAVEPL